MLKKIFKDKISILVFGLIALSLFLRLYHLSWPDWQIFDEIYYYNFGHDYIVGNYFFDVHPPLGKLFISLGLWIFNNSIFGARFFQCLAGALILYLVYIFTKELFKNRLIALFALIILFLETSFFVESRYALINIFIILFTVPAYICFWRYREQNSNNYLYFSLFFVSLATSVKWTGIFTLGVFFIFIIFDTKIRTIFIKTFSDRLILRLIYCLAALIIPYVLLYLPDAVKGDKFFTWHLQAFGFHKNLVSHHPYASKWYQWLIDARPLWLEFKQLPNSDVIGILEVGNIVILWTAVIAFFANIFTIIKTKNKALIFILLAIIVNLIPWMVITRESFYYHFVPMLSFVVISCAYFLYQLYIKNTRWVVILFFVLALSFFVWYFPLLVGSKISFSDYNSRVLFSSWR